MNRPKGIDASDEFLEYMSDLRETWPADESTENSGSGAGNARSSTKPMTETSSDDSSIDTNITRRRALQLAGATAAAAVAGTAPAAAASDLNYGSGLVPNFRVEADVTVAEHDRANMSSPTEYINDSGDLADLANEGGRVQERDDSDSPHNPITLRADRFDATELRAFPRGVTYDSDGDGTDDSDVRALDATHWSVDESGTAGTMTVEDVKSPADTTALRVTTSSQASGDVAIASFSDFSLTDGENRKYLQLAVTVDSLPSGSVVRVRAVDEDGDYKEAVIDPSADSTATSTIATATGPAQVYQAQFGDLSLNGGGSWNNIESLEVHVEDANPDITLTALNVERESAWTFGTEEFLNSDSEVDTRTVREPSGSYSITGIDTLGSEFDGATLVDVQAALAFEPSGAPAEQVDYVFEDADRYSYERRFKAAKGVQLPTAYDLSYANETLADTLAHPSDRHLTVEYVVGTGGEWPTVDTHDDYSWTDKTGTYDNSSIDSDVTLSTSDPAPDKEIVVYYDVLVTSEEESDMTASSGGGGAPAMEESGGIFGLSSAQAFIGTLIAGAAGYFGIIRRRMGA
jgi:hypothetical protein